MKGIINIILILFHRNPGNPELMYKEEEHENVRLHSVSQGEFMLKKYALVSKMVISLEDIVKKNPKKQIYIFLYIYIKKCLNDK